MTDKQFARQYLEALRLGDARAIISVLADDVKFVSPFSVWNTRQTVEAACTARTRAFGDLEGVTAVEHGGDAFVRWRAKVGTRDVEGVDVLSTGTDGVRTIDVFLRPADALDEVYAAMTAAWPR